MDTWTIYGLFCTPVLSLSFFSAVGTLKYENFEPLKVSSQVLTQKWLEKRNYQFLNFYRRTISSNKSRSNFFFWHLTCFRYHKSLSPASSYGIQFIYLVVLVRGARPKNNERITRDSKRELDPYHDSPKEGLPHCRTILYIVKIHTYERSLRKEEPLARWLASVALFRFAPYPLVKVARGAGIHPN